MSQKLRTEVAENDRWDVEALYASMQDWRAEFATIRGEVGAQERWPELSAFRGTLGKSAARLREFFEVSMRMQRSIQKLYTYAHLRHDEDLANDEAKQAYQEIVGVYTALGQSLAWAQPEILALSDETMSQYLSSQELADYQFHLEKIARLKPHTLPADQEKLIALAAKPLMASQQAFSALNNADFDFGEVLDGSGEKHPLTHGTYAVHLQSQDRVLRENSFKKILGTYEGYENTICELLAGQVQGHLFDARARGYKSCLDGALYPKNIDTSVYHSLIEGVRNRIGTHHRYLKLRQQLLGVDQLHLYDTYVPVVSDVDIKMDFDEAVDLCVDSVAPLGSEYQEALAKGLREERWTDRYENKGKRSGAYSSGCFDSHPYILMNYKGILRDVFTLAHEAGHSMHSYLSRKNQPYHMSNYTIFVAEVASTFNETLLHNTLMERRQDPMERAYLINQRIDDIRATLFRQTLFAEFELMLHTWAEQERPLTPQFLKEEYLKLNRFYFGDEVALDDEIAVEWARIPHFYYNFYVYQYATGVSAALSLADQVVSGGEEQREAYLSFLKGGSSQYSLDLLAGAGVDMRTKEPVEQALCAFDRLVDELEGLMATV